MNKTISEKLFNTLTKGKLLLNKESLERITHFVKSQKTEEDIFINKNNTPDLYYTMFGWLLSYVLGIHTDDKKTSAYINQQKTTDLDFIHYAAFIRCRLLQKCLSKRFFALGLGRLFPVPVRPLYTFSRFPHDDVESPYSRFVWLSMIEDANQKIRNKTELKTTLMKYHVPEGGFSNDKENQSATTNATVAALSILGQLYGYTVNKDVLYLKALQQESGGFSVAPHSPIPDLLSTATALFSLHCYQVKPKISPRDFIEAHWLDSGGFSATLLEDTSDVEYTFYALLALGTTDGL